MFESNQDDLFSEGNSSFIIAYLAGIHIIGIDALSIDVPETTDFKFLDESVENLSVLHDVSNWKVNEPNDFNLEEHCLTSLSETIPIFSTTLNDFRCETKRSEEVFAFGVAFFCTDVFNVVVGDDQDIGVVGRGLLENIYFGGMLISFIFFVLCFIVLLKKTRELYKNNKFLKLLYA